jgi:hypothetical protein
MSEAIAFAVHQFKKFGKAKEKIVSAQNYFENADKTRGIDVPFIRSPYATYATENYTSFICIPHPHMPETTAIKEQHFGKFFVFWLSFKP